MVRSLALACLAALALPSLAAPLGSSFTYQGQLSDGGQPANGLYDFQFCLFDSLVGGAQIACAPLASSSDLPVEEGMFTTVIDFGLAAFPGEQRFLEIRVREGDAATAFEALAPRQLVTATPEALHARSVAWGGIPDVPSGLADGVDNVGVTSVAAGGASSLLPGR